MGGTLEALRLAIDTGGASARLHFVSSVAALPVGVASDEQWVTLSADDMAARDGYGQTKAVCERLLHAAHAACGLDVTVLRPSVICGDSRTGYSSEYDLENLLLRACVELGCAVKRTSLGLGWIPADVVADAVVRIATRPAPTPEARAEVFHLNGTGPVLPEVLAEVECAGFELDDVSEAQWRARLDTLPEDRATALLRQISFPSPNIVNVSHTNCAARAALGVAADARWPDVGAQSIQRSIRYLVEVGFFRKRGHDVDERGRDEVASPPASPPPATETTGSPSKAAWTRPKITPTGSVRL